MFRVMLLITYILDKNDPLLHTVGHFPVTCVNVSVFWHLNVYFYVNDRLGPPLFLKWQKLVCCVEQVIHMLCINWTAAVLRCNNVSN